MHILHTEASLGWGGQEIRILNEALAMKKRGHKVVFAIQKKGCLVKKAEEHGFLVYEMNFKKTSWLSAFFRLAKILKKEKIDLINTHSSLDAWIAGIVARCFRVRVVRTRHLSAKVKKGLNSILIYHFLTDFVVTTCEKIIPMLSAQSKKPLQYFQSIPTGIIPEKMKVSKEDVRNFRKKYGVEEKDILVGMVCFMRSWKGIEDFFKAADILKNEPNLKWIIVGGGHSETYIRKAQNMHLNHMIFPGHLENPYPAIAALDIFVLLSSANEGVSQASLQAAYFAKPLVTTPTGGLSEVCIDQKTGILVPIFSPGKVAEAILQLKKDSSLRKSLGEDAKNLVLKKFTFTQTIDEMEVVYSKILTST